MKSIGEISIEISIDGLIGFVPHLLQAERKCGTTADDKTNRRPKRDFGNSRRAGSARKGAAGAQHSGPKGRRDRHRLEGSFSPLQAGFAFLPFSIGIVVGSTIASHLTPRMGESRTMMIGLAAASAGIIWRAQLIETSGFFELVLPAITVMSLGLGIYVVPASSSALLNVPDSDGGVASALVNAMQQVGGALGPALLNTIFLGGVASSASDIIGYR